MAIEIPTSSVDKGFGLKWLSVTSIKVRLVQCRKIYNLTLDFSYYGTMPSYLGFGTLGKNRNLKSPKIQQIIFSMKNGQAELSIHFVLWPPVEELNWLKLSC